MSSAWIVDAIRTPIGRRGGALSSLHAVELGALPLRALVARTGIDPGDLDDVIYGCATPVGEQGGNVGRLCALEAGFPVSVPGVQVHRGVGSSQQALHFAAMGVASGFQDLVIAGGVASTSRVPVGSDLLLDGRPVAFPPELTWRFSIIEPAHSAELVVRRYGLTPEELAAWVLESQRRAAHAWQAGWVAPEVVDVVLASGRVVARDEGVPSDITEAPPSDGAAALLVASDEALRRYGLQPRARVVSTAAVGVDPTIMLTGALPAALQALERAGLGIGDLDAVELHEEFPGVALGCGRALELDFERTNRFGGALASGDPPGASGAKLMTTLLNVLDQGSGRYGLQTMSIGFGQATATVVERVS